MSIATASSRARCQTASRRKSCMRKECVPPEGGDAPLQRWYQHSDASSVQSFVGPVCQSRYFSTQYEVLQWQFDSVSAPTPLLPQPPRRVRAEDPDHQVDQSTDDHDLDGQGEQHSEEAEREAKQAERDPEDEQPADGEQADHEDGAKHGTVSRTGLTSRTRVEEVEFQRLTWSPWNPPRPRVRLRTCHPWPQDVHRPHERRR